jgi:hypothetical protein
VISAASSETPIPRSSSLLNTNRPLLVLDVFGDGGRFVWTVDIPSPAVCAKDGRLVVGRYHFYLYLMRIITFIARDPFIFRFTRSPSAPHILDHIFRAAPFECTNSIESSIYNIFYYSHHCAQCGQLAAVDAMVPTTSVVPRIVEPQHTQVLHDFSIGNWLLFLLRTCRMVDLDSLSRFLVISI